MGGGNQRIGTGFSCHKDDNIIRQLLDRLKINYSVDLSRVRRKEGSGIYVAFWLFEILLNLNELSDKLFKYYPKRRRMFIERLLAQTTVKNIMGKTSRLTPISKKLYMTSTFEIKGVKTKLNSLAPELENSNTKTYV